MAKIKAKKKTASQVLAEVATEEQSGTADKGVLRVIVKDEEVSDDIRRWVEGKHSYDTAVNEMAVAAPRIFNLAAKIRLEKSQEAQRVIPSVRLIAGSKSKTEKEAASVIVTQSSRFKGLDPDDCLKPLREGFGEDFPKYFTVRRHFFIDAAKMTTAEANKVKEALGDRAKELLRYVRTVEVKDEFKEAAVLSEDVREKLSNLPPEVCVPVAASITE